jgi:hypothetical protein
MRWHLSAKTLIPILGGLLTFESDWSPAFGDPILRALVAADEAEQLDIGCIAAHGVFQQRRFFST